jgi:hypothetical protein
MTLSHQIMLDQVSGTFHSPFSFSFSKDISPEKFQTVLVSSLVLSASLVVSFISSWNSAGRICHASIHVSSIVAAFFQ